MENKLDRLHGIAFLIGSLTHAAEKNLGQGSLSSCALAGKKFGQEAVEGTETTDDPIRAIDLLNTALKKRGIVWDFVPFQGEHEELIEERDGARVVRLVSTPAWCATPSSGTPTSRSSPSATCPTVFSPGQWRR